jgi:flagellar motility protein MotE (MotC chaperone)
MILRIASDFRLVPIVLLATIALFALKVSGLLFDGGYTLADRLQDRLTAAYPARPRDDGTEQGQSNGAAPQPWAEAQFKDSNSDDITGSTGKSEKPAETKTAKPEEKLQVSDKAPGLPKIEAGGASTTIEPGHINSAGERALIESLQGRREQLDARSRELDMRENLLKATEKRLEAKVAELKSMEAQLKTELGNRDKKEAERLKGLITMYEGMKAKEAARIFDRLDMKVLLEVSTQMNPRSMSSILAQMNPEAAERLTVELASRAGGPASQNAKQLPKIEGKPTGGR